MRPPYKISPLTGLRLALGIAIDSECNGDVCVKYVDGCNKEEVIAAVTNADVAIVAIATTSTEGFDRKTLGYGDEQDGLVNLTAKHQPNTVVVCTAPGPVLTPWRHNVKSILINFYPGQEYGNALADGRTWAEVLSPHQRLPA